MKEESDNLLKEAKKLSMRPGGVTGIAILFLLGGVALLALGIMCTAMTAFVVAFWDANIGPLLAWVPILGERLVALDPGTCTLIGYVLIPIGAVDLVTFIGLLKLKKWGYWLAILISIPLIVVILGIIFIWYLRKDEVKAAFDIM